MFMSRADTLTAPPDTASLNLCDRAIRKMMAYRKRELFATGPSEMMVYRKIYNVCKTPYKNTYIKYCKYLNLYVDAGLET